MIRGGADGFVTKQLVDTIVPRFPGAREKAVDRGGHWLHVEQPGAVAEMLLEFSDEITEHDDGQRMASGFRRTVAGHLRRRIRRPGRLGRHHPRQADQGKQQVAQVLATASSIYESLEFTAEAHHGPTTYLQWRATAFGGMQIRGVTILDRDASGKIVAAAIHHRPLGAVLAVRGRAPQPTRRRDPSRSFPAGDSMTASLNYKLFVTEQIPQSGRGPLPDGTTRMWSPITSTLILGTREAVLVDPPLTDAQAADVGDWIESSGRQLRQIYITHGHGDHWFGAIPLLKRFPGVAVRATEGTTRHMAGQNTPEFRAEFWDKVFPGQLPSGDVDVEVVDDRGFELEGVGLVPIEVGHTDTDATTMLHVPQIGLVVAGDVVYNGVHLYLAESRRYPGIDEWLAALDVAEGLRPAAVIAGHKSPGASTTRRRSGDAAVSNRRTSGA